MSKIEWTDKTWNPIIGCAKVSVGCKNCYAETMAARVALMEKAQGKESPYLRVVDADRRRWNRRAVFLPERLGEPLHWRKPRRVFVNSMSDLFHEDIRFEQVAAVFGVMAATPHLTYQVLTKRAARMLEFFAWLTEVAADEFCGSRVDLVLSSAATHVNGDAWDRNLDRAGLAVEGGVWPLPNVHIGVSVEDQAAADERIPLLLQCPAALRFLSVEPLLEPVKLNLAGIGWVIVGGESGPGARPCGVEWIRSVVDQCRSAGVPVFVKQLGSHPTAASAEAIGDSMFAAIEASDMETAVMLRDGSLCRLRLDDRKGADPSEWPEDLRVQERPR